MRIKDDCVEFEEADMPFVARFGLEEAADMVLDFAQFNAHPFLFDTYQLADFLGIHRKKLFSLVRRCESQYRKVNIAKSSGGVRTLYVPASLLRNVQRRILHGILDFFPASPYAMAYCPGRTLRDNASPHCGKKYLLKLDLQDFFDSIRFDQIYSTVFHTGRFPRQIGTMLTALCCHRDVLPQGAPTSPALSNLVLKHFDSVLGDWCSRRGIAYTRYCDDLTFSADVPLYGAYCKVCDLLKDTCFTINERKTRWITNASAQLVTGLTVNEKVGIPTDYKRDLRQQVYYVLRYGPADAIRRGERTAFLREGEPLSLPYCRHLLGRVEHVLHIQPELEYFQKARRSLRQIIAAPEWEDDLPF